MHTLYPDIAPFKFYHLSVGESDDIGASVSANVVLEVTQGDQSVQHQLYVEHCGNPQGIPVLFLHGGPGAGCREKHRCYFNPALYHIILFDQRGCGRSLPTGDLTNNTADHLMQDIEQIRQHIGIKQWLIFGGSWGSTLGLYYAQHYPKHVLGMILRGVFLARQQDIDWAYGADGAAKLFPEAWHNLVKDLPVEQQQEPLSAIYQQLSSHNSDISQAMFNKLDDWECSIVTLRARLYPLASSEISSTTSKTKTTKIAASIIQLYYSLHQCFISEHALLEHIDPIRHLPTKIIHGRYDMVCPVEQAWKLKQHWPEAELNIIEMAGHVADEPKMIDALISATNEFSIRFHSSS